EAVAEETPAAAAEPAAEESVVQSRPVSPPVDDIVADVEEQVVAAAPDTDVEAAGAPNEESESIPVVEEGVAEAADETEAAEAETIEVQVADEEKAAPEAEEPDAVAESDAEASLEATAVADATEVMPAADESVAPAEPVVPVIVSTAGEQGAEGPAGPQGPMGPMGPPGPAGAASVEGSVDFLMKFTAPTIGGNSQVFDDGNFIGIGTTEPKQRLEVNGNIQIHERNSSVAGLMITQSDGETGYIMHNRASTLTIGAGSIDRITIDRDGNVGFGVTRPSNPFELANGAHVTAGGVWTNASSRALKENIESLSADAALETLAELEPVQFNYKNDQAEGHVGFIAEDVPDLVAMQDRDGLSAMDIVAVLTKVVQEQQRKIEALEARLEQR
ncbi:MAG: tail fiber domain-containing protein, partial [Gammaproteobacteria bacterium]|nr:tail fiber domain-containing protein [Gammaproteobacteria bacterium]